MYMCICSIPSSTIRPLHMHTTLTLSQMREEDYWRMKRQWEAFTPDQEKRFSKWREAKHLISTSSLVHITSKTVSNHLSTV